MPGQYYVPLKRSGRRLKPVEVTSDFSRVLELYDEREIVGYVSGPMIRLSRTPGNDTFAMKLEALPWREVGGSTGAHAYYVLSRAIRKRQKPSQDGYREPTVRDLIDLFSTTTAERKELRIRNYGTKSHEITKEVLRRIGLELAVIDYLKSTKSLLATGPFCP